ncbi:MAG: hypothetical protein ACYTGZ_12510 [Planctomycetota bacterium]|jgi:hypothetical protein
MRAVRYVLLFLLVVAGVGSAQDGLEAVACEAVPPGREGSVVLRSAILTLEAVHGRSRASVRFAADGTGTARVRRGARYRVRPRGLVVRAGPRTLSVPHGEYSVEPTEITVPAAGPIPEPRFRFRIRRGEHTLRIFVRTHGGRPIAGARLVVSGLGKKGRPATPYDVLESDVNGAGVVPNLPAGHMRVDLVSPGPFAVRPQRVLISRRRSRHVIPGEQVVVGSGEKNVTTFRLEGAGVLRVTVDTEGLKEAPPVAVWTTMARLVAGPRTRPDSAGGLYRFPSLAPGRYRVVATLPDGGTMFTEAEVRSGFVTPVRLTRSRAGRNDYQFFLLWERMPKDVPRARFYLTRLYDGQSKTVVFESRRGGALARTYGPALHNGPYLLRYAALNLARVEQLDASKSWAIDFTPPPKGFLTRGHRTVTVRVMRNGKPVKDVFVALQQQKRTRERNEKWMRYAGTTEEGAVFESVPAGWYSVRLIDDVMGVHHGFRVLTRRVSLWRTDVTLDISLSGR